MNYLAAAKAEQRNETAREELLRSQTVTRYVFCAYLDAVVPSLGSFGGRLPKGRIVPIYRPWRMVNLRKEGVSTNELDQMRFQRVKDPTTRRSHPYLAKEYFSPAEVIDWIAREYAGSGAGEITSLAGLDVAEFEKLRLNSLLFGVSDDDLDTAIFPTAKSYYERFEAVATQLPTQKEKFPQQTEMLSNVLREVTKLVEQAERKASENALLANNLLAAGDIRRFDTGQQYAFQFSGVTKRDDALNNLATLQNNAVEKAFQPAQPQFDMTAFMAGMQEMVGKIAAETAKATAIEVVKAVAAPPTPVAPEKTDKPNPAPTPKK